MLRLCILAVLMSVTGAAQAQTADFRVLNEARVRTDMRGMKVLGAWGAVNTVAGIAGAISASDGEWKHFHQMNASWGIVNLGIAGLGYLGARRELRKELTGPAALHRYESTKRLYLLNAGLDGLYIGTGVFLLERGQYRGDRDMHRGFGKALILQGAGLLIFDVTMFCSHQHQDKRWYKLLQGVTVTGNGIGLRYALN